jgi:peptidoglycan/LPS O-acetylase OafA/YrhL
MGFVRNTDVFVEIPKSQGARIEQLDSVRGLAALSVVLCHHLIAYPRFWDAYVFGPQGNKTGLFFPPVYILWAGHSAVVLFFVLSGYVLFLPTLQHRQPTYGKYLIKRFCRIYLPQWLGLVCFRKASFLA